MFDNFANGFSRCKYNSTETAEANEEIFPFLWQSWQLDCFN